VDISRVPGVPLSGRYPLYDRAIVFSRKTIRFRSSSVLLASGTEDFPAGSHNVRLIRIAHATYHFWPDLAVGVCVANINGRSRHSGQPFPLTCFSVVCDNCDGHSGCLARTVERRRKLTVGFWPSAEVFLVATRRAALCRSGRMSWTFPRKHH